MGVPLNPFVGDVTDLADIGELQNAKMEESLFCWGAGGAGC